MATKKRKTCAICKAKKYLKYMVKDSFRDFPDKEFYICANGSKCLRRSANYRK